MSGPALPSPARERLVRGHAGMAAIVDGDALAMFGLFGLSWAIPAAVVRLGHALHGLLRRARHAATVA